MNCTHIKQYISLMLDGQLAEEDRKAVHKHLETCPGCRRFYRDLQAITRAAAQLPAPEPVDDWARLQAALDAPETRQKRPGRMTGLAAMIAMMAALVVMSAVLFRWIISSHSGAAAGQNVEVALVQAEDNYAQAIADLNRTLAIDRLPDSDGFRQFCRANLLPVEASITHWQGVLNRAPGNIEARLQLFNCYADKMDLLQEFIAIKPNADLFSQYNL